VAVDLIALKVALESDPRYDVAVRVGKNRDLLRLLDEEELGQSLSLVVSRDAVLEAIGSAIRTMTPDNHEILNIYITSDTVDFRRSTVLPELLSTVVDVDGGAVFRLLEVAHRTRTYGEAFGDRVSLRDLWAVLPKIPKSYMATRKAAGSIRAKKVELDLVVLTAKVQSENPKLRVSQARSEAIRRHYA